MHALLRVMARAVAVRPGLLLALLAAATLVLGGLATQLEVETDIASFAADTDLARGFDTIEETFGGRGARVQVIVDAGRGGNVLSAEGLAVAQRIEDLVDGTPEVADRLAPDGLAGPAVVSYGAPFGGRFAALGTSVEELPEPFVASLVADTLGSMGDRVEPLLSSDADLDRGTARAGLAVIELDPDLDQGTLERANLALRDALAAEDFGWFDVRPFSFLLLADDIEAGLFEDLPLLMAASVLLIVIILWLLFRRAADVALGVGALGIAIVWMNGAAAVLGPGFLGLTGAFSQIAVAVPVLLVGLGIDYTVHLIARYRENLSRGHAPAGAAQIAMRTVGVALVLATITTVVGFLSNLVTPVPPIADFGVFAAAGIVAAFIVSGLLVPGARALLDRRRAARGDALAGTAEAPRDGVADIGRLLGRVAVVAARAPVTVLCVAALLAAVAAVAASDLDTEFAQEDFIPAESEAGQLITLMADRFGGDVSERTHVLVEADFTDPAVLNALLAARTRLAGVPGVVTAGGAAEVSSPATLIQLVDREAEEARERLAGQLQLLADPDAAAAALPLPALRGPDDLPDLGGGEGDEVAAAFPGGTAALEERLPPGVPVEEALLRVIPAEELDRALRQAIAEELRDERPAGVDQPVLDAAAALPPEDLDRFALAALGFAVEELDEATLDLLDTAAELRALGWDGERVAGADVEGLYAVLHREASAELDAVLAPDRRSGLVTVTTTAGQRGADALAERLEDELAPLRALGASLLVVSEPLLIEETLATLADAQTVAIAISLAAAALLLVGYYGLAGRRPMLGVIAMVPSLLAVVLTLGAMWLLGLAYNALTATIASIAIGIGVPYGIHVTNRFVEERRRAPDPAAGIRATITHTGAALAGSAVTTASAFAVLGLSNLVPLRQFGIVTAIMIVFALLAALFAETSCLVLWDRHRRRRDGDGPRPEHAPTAAWAGRP